MSPRLASFWHWCRRYISLPLMIAVAYMIFVLYFNENSYSRSAQLQEEIDLLQAEIKENTDSMMYYYELNRSLDSDPEALERIVREKYHMQRLNEDVYIITD